MTFHVERIDHVVLRVRDLPAMVKFYETVLSTPLSPNDLALGELGWALVRGGLYSVGFLVIMALMGLIQSPWAILALPAALVIGFGFGAIDQSNL